MLISVVTLESDPLGQTNTVCRNPNNTSSRLVCLLHLYLIRIPHTLLLPSSDEIPYSDHAN